MCQPNKMNECVEKNQLSPAGHFVCGGSDDFSQLRQKKSNVNCFFKWKVMKLEHMEAIWLFSKNKLPVFYIIKDDLEFI